MAVVYTIIKQFPDDDFIIPNIVTKNFFKSVCNITIVKIFLHHSNATGKIHGYEYDFCNRKASENRNLFRRAQHTTSLCSVFYLVKGIRLSVWRIKDFCIGRSNLTYVNFPNLGEEIKFADMFIYYQQILACLTKTVTPEEKVAIIKRSHKFLQTHNYFKKVWCTLDNSLQNKILELFASGKGVIP